MSTLLVTGFFSQMLLEQRSVLIYLSKQSVPVQPNSFQSPCTLAVSHCRLVNKISQSMGLTFGGIFEYSNRALTVVVCISHEAKS